MKRPGVAIVGHTCRDVVKIISGYPKLGMLTEIREISQSVGGAVPNTSISLARMGGDIRVSAIGSVGSDDAGQFVLERMQTYGVDTSGFVIDPECYTSFTDVMHDRETGERTFFLYNGCNETFSPGQVDLDSLDCDYLHAAYIMLLARFDAPDETYGTAMARFLHDVQARGIQTSVDVASRSADVFAQTATPALRYCDTVFMNEVEAEMLFGLPSRDSGGALLTENIEKTMRRCLREGVRRRVILHCPEAGFCLEADGSFTIVPSLALPADYIQGSVGAGDAFCAGCLRRICLGGSAEEMLAFASAASAANLSAPDSISGMRSEEEILQLMRRFPRREFP